MSIFTQSIKNVDHEISALENQLQQQKEYREQLQSANETAQSSLKALSETMRQLNPEDADTVKREVTRWLGLDDMPANDSTIETDSPSSNDNGSSEQTTKSEVSVFDPVTPKVDNSDSAPKPNGNGKSEQSEGATDSTKDESTESTSNNGDNGASSQSEASDASNGEDENGVVKHEYFPDEYVQIFDKSHHYNGRVCLIKKLVRTGYYCVLEPRTDEQGGETEELLLKPHQVIKYQDYEITADGLDDAPKFPTFKEDQRVWVKQDGKEFKHQGQIVQLHDDGKAKVKLDGYSNPITIAQKDIKDASKKSTQAPSSG
jgi:hypothetical protein